MSKEELLKTVRVECYKKGNWTLEGMFEIIYDTVVHRHSKRYISYMQPKQLMLWDSQDEDIVTDDDDEFNY